MVIRVRPLTNSYQALNGGDELNTDTNVKRCIRAIRNEKEIEIEGTPPGEKFTFDFIANETSTQEEIFKRVSKPIVDSCIQGYNSTVFAYGQTGSGKTHTIQGTQADKGILPRQFEYLFQSLGRVQTKHRFMKERGKSRNTTSPSGHDLLYQQFGDDIEEIQFEVICSYTEIYNEQIQDLLDSSGNSKLQIREDAKRGVVLEGETQQVAKSLEDVYKILA